MRFGILGPLAVGEGDTAVEIRRGMPRTLLIGQLVSRLPLRVGFHEHLARLQNRFDLLVEGGRDAAARQQTLRAALDWSFELLEADQRRFFALLGVFAVGPEAAHHAQGDRGQSAEAVVACLLTTTPEGEP